MEKAKTLVHTLRAQSVQTRKTILVLGAFGLTGLIVIIWILSFAFAHTDYVAPDTSSTDTNTTQPTVDQSTKESPFAIIKDSITGLYSSASQHLGSKSSQ